MPSNPEFSTHVITWRRNDNTQVQGILYGDIELMSDLATALSSSELDLLQLDLRPVDSTAHPLSDVICRLKAM